MLIVFRSILKPLCFWVCLYVFVAREVFDFFTVWEKMRIENRQQSRVMTCVWIWIFPPFFFVLSSVGEKILTRLHLTVFNWLLRKNEERKTHQEVAKSEWIAWKAQSVPRMDTTGPCWGKNNSWWRDSAWKTWDSGSSYKKRHQLQAGHRGYLGLGIWIPCLKWVWTDKIPFLFLKISVLCKFYFVFLD